MPVDKGGSNFGFICKKNISAEVLQSEIVNSDTFEFSANALIDIKNTCYNFFNKYKIIPSSFNIPFMYAIPTFPKVPTKSITVFRSNFWICLSTRESINQIFIMQNLWNI